MVESGAHNPEHATAVLEGERMMERCLFLVSVDLCRLKLQFSWEVLQL